MFHNPSQLRRWVEDLTAPIHLHVLEEGIRACPLALARGGVRLKYEMRIMVVSQKM